MSETLSDNRIMDEGNNFIYEESDVKEFIRKLKIELGADRDGLIGDWGNKKINDLAGEKLL